MVSFFVEVVDIVDFWIFFHMLTTGTPTLHDTLGGLAATRRRREKPNFSIITTRHCPLPTIRCPLCSVLRTDRTAYRRAARSRAKGRVGERRGRCIATGLRPSSVGFGSASHVPALDTTSAADASSSVVVSRMALFPQVHRPRRSSPPPSYTRGTS
ncbi:hypothetical protein K440DRAFT_157917 [Wilcoxina mikolae CBS 423.85]|nr:hypothetical protein K440DRAFT_157917 [Wilcoxina mikolae CBS 423.85]